MGEGGGRAERTPAVGKPLCHFWGWMGAKAPLSLPLQVHKVSLKVGCCIVARHTHLKDVRLFLAVVSLSKANHPCTYPARTIVIPFLGTG